MIINDNNDLKLHIITRNEHIYSFNYNGHKNLKPLIKTSVSLEVFFIYDSEAANRLSTELAS